MAHLVHFPHKPLQRLLFITKHYGRKRECCGVVTSEKPVDMHRRTEWARRSACPERSEVPRPSLCSGRERNSRRFTLYYTVSSTVSEVTWPMTIKEYRAVQLVQKNEHMLADGTILLVRSLGELLTK